MIPITRIGSKHAVSALFYKNFHHSCAAFFWTRHIALFHGVTIIFGASSVLCSPVLCVLFCFLWSTYILLLRKWSALCTLAFTLLYCSVLYSYEPIAQETEGIFSISSLQTHQSPFQKGHVYQGTLFLSDGSIPCCVYTHGDIIHKACSNYFVTGSLHKRDRFSYTLRPKQWVPIPYTYSSAQFRYLIQQKYRALLQEKFAAHPHVAEFFSAFTIGNLEDRFLAFTFQRIGLQHILGVSGFHFVILGCVLSFGLAYFLSRTGRLCSLILLCTIYWLFLGPSPAVQRCFIMSVLYLIGKLCNRRINGCNLLGFTMGCEVIINPPILTHVGFQLSFAGCFGIFFLYPILEQKLRSVLPKRTKQEIAALSPLAKHGYLFSSFLRRMISLTCAVHIFILPIILFHFRSFPLLNLFYNLFYPLCADCTLCLLMASLCIHLICPYFATLCFSITGYLTSLLLQWASYPPNALDYSLLTPSFPWLLLPFYLFVIFHLFVKKFSTLSYKMEPL